MRTAITSPYTNHNPYVPQSLSEINDLLGAMLLDAPTFIDPLGYFPDRNINSRFHQLTEGLRLMHGKLGEERYAALIQLATAAQLLFAADQNDSNGKTDEGRALLFEMEDILKDARSARAKAELRDDEGEVTGD